MRPDLALTRMLYVQPIQLDGRNRTLLVRLRRRLIDLDCSKREVPTGISVEFVFWRVWLEQAFVEIIAFLLAMHATEIQIRPAIGVSGKGVFGAEVFDGIKPGRGDGEAVTERAVSLGLAH